MSFVAKGIMRAALAGIAGIVLATSAQAQDI